MDHTPGCSQTELPSNSLDWHRAAHVLKVEIGDLRLGASQEDETEILPHGLHSAPPDSVCFIAASESALILPARQRWKAPEDRMPRSRWSKLTLMERLSPHQPGRVWLSKYLAVLEGYMPGNLPAKRWLSFAVGNCRRSVNPET